MMVRSDICEPAEMRSLAHIITEVLPAALTLQSLGQTMQYVREVALSYGLCLTAPPSSKDGGNESQGAVFG